MPAWRGFEQPWAVERHPQHAQSESDAGTAIFPCERMGPAPIATTFENCRLRLIAAFPPRISLSILIPRTRR